MGQHGLAVPSEALQNNPFIGVSHNVSNPPELEEVAEIARRKECLLIVDAAAPASTGIQFMDLLRKGSALEKRIPLHIRNTPLFVQGKIAAAVDQSFPGGFAGDCTV